VALGFEHCTAEITGHVVVEHFHLSSYFWAFAGAIDEIATARAATKSDTAFMALITAHAPDLGQRAAAFQ
jgi:hypothetical protein